MIIAYTVNILSYTIKIAPIKDYYAKHYYIIYCTINISRIPGTPKTPTIKAVIGLTPMWIPINPPIKFKSIKTTPPIIPLIISLKINFKGIRISHPIMNNKSIPTKYATITLTSSPIPTKSPLLQALYIKYIKS